MNSIMKASKHISHAHTLTFNTDFPFGDEENGLKWQQQRQKLLTVKMENLHDEEEDVDGKKIDA